MSRQTPLYAARNEFDHLCFTEKEPSTQQEFIYSLYNIVYLFLFEQWLRMGVEISRDDFSDTLVNYCKVIDDLFDVGVRKKYISASERPSIFKVLCILKQVVFWDDGQIKYHNGWNHSVDEVQELCSMILP